MTLIETRVFEIKPDDEWLLEGAWVLVTDVVPGAAPADRWQVNYVSDGEANWDSEFRGFEVAVVKRSADPRRGEALLQLASYRIALDYGDPAITRDVTDGMAAFLTALFGITEDDITEAVHAESPSSE